MGPLPLRPRLPRGSAAVLALALGACATSRPPTAAPRAAANAPAAAHAPALRPTRGPDADSSPLGLYLAAETALGAGESAPAARLFARAAAADPDDAELRQRAFTTNLLAGEVGVAARLAPDAAATPEAAALGRLVRAVDALADGRGREAAALLADASATRGYGGAAALLTPWAAAAAGEHAAPAAVAPPPGADKTVGRFAALGRARLLERAGDVAGAEPVFKTLAADRQAMFTQAYGEFLERRGRRAEALTAYDTALATTGDAALRAARARAAAAGPAPAQPTVRQGAAEALLGPAASLLAQRRRDLGLIYVRLALRLAPELDAAWLVVGDTLAATGETEAARDAYRRVRADGPEGPAALERLALAAQTDGDKAEALRLARRAAAGAPGDVQAGIVLAEVLRSQDRLDEAIAVLDPLVAAHPLGEDAERVLFLRGAALERAGKWPEAQADLKRALELKPDDPEVMNYLGFAWADRGEHLKEALALLERAAAAQPGQGAVLDSVGWARFRMGDLRGALRDVEKAVSLEPADPEINQHLGDIYQRVGRRAEARYQWRRVLTLDPDTRVRAAAESRLREAGEAPPAAAPAATPAASATPTA